MAYDEQLAERVRHSLANRADVVEKKMFGGVSFMVAGNMCCGVNRTDLILRLDGGTHAGDLGSPHARAWDFMTRPMKGMFAVGAAGCTDQPSVDRWVGLALKHALSLPAKAASPARRTRRPR